MANLRAKVEINQYPTALLEDRYSGVYSGGSWIAIANFKERDFYKWVYEASGDDIEAASFWPDVPENWAVGDTPEEALANLRAKGRKSNES